MSEILFAAGQPQSGPSRQRKNVACRHCRMRKIRCNGSLPCTNCLDRGEKCVMGTKKARGQGHKAALGGYDPTDLVRQIEELKAMIESKADDAMTTPTPTTRPAGFQGFDHHGGTATNCLPTRPPPASLTSPSPAADQDIGARILSGSDFASSSVSPSSNRQVSKEPLSDFQNLVFVQECPGARAGAGAGAAAAAAETHILPEAEINGDSTMISSGLDTQNTERESSSVFTAELLNVEYYGPRSFLSFASPPGIEWVNSKIGSSEFGGVANRLISGFTSMLKINSGPRSELAAAEPLTADIAWQYSKGKQSKPILFLLHPLDFTYFEEAPEAVFGVIDRCWFENRLLAHFNEPKRDESKLWYALRNVVWATGCRIVLSRSSNFSTARRASWALFENALSVYADLLFSRSSVVAVQVLVAMAYFCEGIASPALQYVMCSTALRLACSKGLHRQPALAWNMSPLEVDRRNWTFWAIYCLEKQIAARSGRPSAIEDDEISCLIPGIAVADQPNYSDGGKAYCHVLIEMMKLSSIIMRSLSSARALRQTGEELVETVRDLSLKLEQLKYSFEDIMPFTSHHLDLSVLPTGMTLTQALMLRYNYLCLVLHVSTPLATPWSGALMVKRGTAAYAEYEKACATAASASRAAILLARHIPVSAYCPSLIAQYGPIYGFLALFVHVLRDVVSPSTAADLVLMDIALGYFSNLEFGTDFVVSLPCVKDLARFTRMAAERARLDQGQRLSATAGADLSARGPQQTVMSVSVSSVAVTDFGFRPSGQIDFADAAADMTIPQDLEQEGMDMAEPRLADDDVEMWSTLIQFGDTADDNAMFGGGVGDFFS